MAVKFPMVGQWFRRTDGTLFEVVATDDVAGTVEIQLFDGTIDEVDIEAWPELLPVEVSAPEDWSGSVDMDPEDDTLKTNGEMPHGYHDPLAFLDKV